MELNDPNPFDKACSRGAIYSVIHSELSPGCLRHLLECWLSGDFKDLDRTIIPSRESLERDAEELTAIGLPRGRQDTGGSRRGSYSIL
jgi:hypothetical protein